jgi:hypothetical protein
MLIAILEPFSAADDWVSYVRDRCVPQIVNAETGRDQKTSGAQPGPIGEGLPLEVNYECPD